MDKTTTIKLTKTMEKILLLADASMIGAYHPGFMREKRAIWAMQEQGLFGPLCWDATYPITELGRTTANAVRDRRTSRQHKEERTQ